ncbi:inositol 2-dehydrogenase [Paenibacillus piri]|uniref:Inositol 2-dehydrogenase n=1 Tax=Paenibacillus piri TaxID=2547395 RepID=A0A4R5KX21_9BACL|nr:inositol 2-dehydrogenase [Paenibacillus piri]TDG00574.1 inositol 2-dehydrogenase [Paenibacillus piri]
MTKIKIGIIGVGRIGKLHAGHLVRQPNAEVSIVSDVAVTEELRQWAAELGIPRISADYRDVLRDPDIQAVYICSSTHTHVPLIEEAAEQGKHIFCEKPVSMDYVQTERALEAVKKHGVLLQTGFNRRFDHNFKRVRDCVQSGQIGDPHLIKITSRDPAPPPADYIRVSGGLFMDMAIHDFDMARFVANSEVQEVYAQGAVLIDPAIGELGDIDTAITTLKFANGALGVIDNSRQAVYGYDQRVEVFGSAGCIQIANDHSNTAEISTKDAVFRDNPKYFFLERYEQAYADENRAFLQAIASGGQTPVDGNDALQAERIAAAAKRSLQEGRPVKLEEL